jgi:hypothetical protein
VQDGLAAPGASEVTAHAVATDAAENADDGVQRLVLDGVLLAFVGRRHAAGARAREAPPARGGVDLDAVAGREDERLAHSGLRGEARQELREGVPPDGEPLAHLDGRGLVGEPDEDHGR